MSSKTRNRILEFKQTCMGEQEFVWTMFIDFIWKKGAGLWPPVKVEQEGDKHGNGCMRSIALLRKPGILEKIVSVNYPHRIYYKVANPSWATFPVDFHMAWVDFIPVGSTYTKLVWTIEIIPKKNMACIVVGIINYIIPRCLRRLAGECSNT